MFRRVLLLAAVVLVVLASLASAPTLAQTPKHGGTLVVAQNADISGFDPHTLPDFPTVRMIGLIYETLVTVDADLKIQPALAESWQFSSDGLKLTLNLRKGVKFHNGDAFTSADVKYTLQRILDEKTKALVRSNFVDVKSVDTPDDNTVVLTLSRANVSILTALVDPNASIVSAKSAGLDLTDKKNANGTGPFKFQSWEPNQRLVLVANKDYWQKDLPYLDGIEIRVIPQESSILAALRAGQVNFAVLNDPTVATLIKAGSGLTLVRTPALAYHVLQLNSTRKPFTDQKVRQALSCAIDRQQVIDTAALGEGQVTGPNTIPLYRTPVDQLPCYKPDLAKAKQLLSDAGVASGVSFTVIAASQEPPTAVNEAQNIADQLAKIGVTVKIQTMDLDAYVKAWLAGDFDAAIALNGGRADPHLMFVRYWSSQGNLNKVAAYNDSMLDDLLAKGQAETDPQKRVSVYQDFEKHLVDASPWIWTYVGYEYRAMQDTVQGYISTPLVSIAYLRQTWINK
jgi:peptide/nickel transport system substrate-binding protein